MKRGMGTMTIMKANERESRGPVYIYSIPQADYFLQHGLIPTSIGKGQRGDVYLVFARDEATEEVFQLWQAHIDRVRGK